MRHVASLLGIVAGSTLSLTAACGEPTQPKQPPGPPRRPTLTVVSGDLQTSQVGTQLAEPLVVKLLDTLGTSAASVVVRFIRNETTIDSATTDRLGLASVRWTVGEVATTEQITARATLNPSSTGTAETRFAARATPGAPARIDVTGDDAIGAPNASIDTITVFATDRFGNRSPEAPVSWSVTLGGGSIRALASQTDTIGAARAIWTMGPAEGDNTLEVTIGSITRQLGATASLGLPALQVVVGGSHSCALTKTGVAYCWGENASGQLGFGRPDDANHEVPRRVAGDLRFASLTAGGEHTCGLTPAGVAYCWGSSHLGQLGVGGIGLFAAPTAVAGSIPFAMLAAGSRHTCGLTTGHQLFCWGDNTVGQLGDGTDRSSAGAPAGAASPARVALDGADVFVTIAAGSFTTCAAATTGSTYCWGTNAARELGGDFAGRCHVIGSLFIYDGTPVPCTTAPVRVPTEHRIVSLTANGTGWCGVSVNNELLCWGNALDFPRVVAPARIVRAWVFGRDVCGLQPSGAILCWGVWGRIGFPEVRAFGDNVALESFAFGGLHSCGLSRDGRKLVYCGGDNSSGQLGDGTTELRTLPVRVLSPGGG